MNTFTRRLTSGLLPALALLLTACDDKPSEAPVELGKDYYPLQVGAERVFAVSDTTIADNRVTAATSGQIREQLTETYRDAAGVLTYKLVLSSRRAAADAWRVDSVQALTVKERNLLLTRGNRRTVELVFPVREGAEWHKNAFNDAANFAGAANRRYERVGAAFTAAGRRYDNTTTVYAYDGVEGDIFHYYVQRQVYARGLGPVQRVSYQLDYCQPNGGCPAGTKYVVRGRIHREVLLP